MTLVCFSINIILAKSPQKRGGFGQNNMSLGCLVL